MARARRRRVAVVEHRVEADAAGGGLLGERALVDAGDLDGDVQAGGDALDRGVRELVGERLHERVAAGAVAAAHAAQVAVELAALEEVRERLLADPLGAHVGQVLLAADRLEQRRRDDEPAEPQRGRERLARRAGVGDAVGLEALQRADRRAVVAVLGVVVVLDGKGVAVAEPGEQRGAALAGEDGAGGVLVGGREDDGVFVAELLHAQAVVVDRDRDGLEAGAARDQQLLGVGRVLDRDAAGAAGGERVAEQRERLGVAARDHDARRVGDHAADAAEVVGERLAEGLEADPVAVLEVGVGHRRERLAGRAQPGGAREARDVGNAGAEVEARRRRRSGRRLVPVGGGGRVRHARARALPEAQVALGGELAVGVDHHAAGDAELAGEVARARNGGPGLHRTRADRLPQPLLDLGAERAFAVPRHREEELERLTGLVQSHETGSSMCTS